MATRASQDLTSDDLSPGCSSRFTADDIILTSEAESQDGGGYMRSKFFHTSVDDALSEVSDHDGHFSSDLKNLGDTDEEDLTEGIAPPFSSSPPEFQVSSPSTSECMDGDVTPEAHTQAIPEIMAKYPSPQNRSKEPLENINSLFAMALREQAEMRGGLLPDTPVASQRLWGIHPSKNKSKKPPLCRLPTIRDEDEDDNLGDSINGRNDRGISPMSFASNPALCDLPNNVIPCTNATYRIIKRASSYLPVCSPGNSPVMKRQRIAYLDNDSSARLRSCLYACRPASLRRAESLKSDARLHSPTNSSEIRTAPATPMTKLQANPKIPVPIIAPPVDYIAGLPLCKETLSKMRVGRFLERDTHHRELDGLGCQLFSLKRQPLQDVAYASLPGESGRDARTCFEDRLGIGRVMRLNAINWILDALPSIPDPETPSSTYPSLTSSQSTSSSSEDSNTANEAPQVIHNLFDQLSTSRETRFHACWLFLRYFHTTMALGSAAPNSHRGNVLTRASSLDSHSSSEPEHQGRDLIIWDIAVACLSLSVKFHRDFLDPLLPVYSQEYLDLSPHAMSHEDLESAHRDILSALDYSLGHSPQPLMDEMWTALPSLRTLLDFHGGWSHALEDAWMFLFDAVSEPDVQRFSIPLLTTVAILDGIIESVVHRYRSEENGSQSSSPSDSDTEILQHDSYGRSRKVLEQRAMEEAEGVFCDMQALKQIEECRAWMKSAQ